jgi:hypothetical protein
VIETKDLERLAVDTTVTDARLIHRAIEKPVELAKREDVELRQGYLRLAKRICFRLHGRVPCCLFPWETGASPRSCDRMAPASRV